MSTPDFEALRIDSPIHQLREIERVIADTGTAMLFVVGIEELAERLVGLSKEDIADELEAMTMLPEFVMGERPEGTLPILATFALTPQALADELDPVQKDEVSKHEEE